MLGMPPSWVILSAIASAWPCFAGVLEKFLRNRLRMNAPRHEVVILGAEDAHDLGGQGLVENGNNGGAVGLVRIGDRALVHVLAGALANRFDVDAKGW